MIRLRLRVYFINEGAYIMEDYKRIASNIQKTTSERLWNIAGIIIFISSIIFLIGVWKQLPDQVPAHYNAVGEVDRWGSKVELFILPLIGVFTLLFIQPIENRPHIHNFPKRLNANNAHDFFLTSRKMINKIKNIVLISFAAINVESITIAMKWREGFGPYFLPVFIAVIFYPMIEYFIKVRRL